MKLVKDFTEYQIIDMSDGMKLETWNGKELLRPDPQIIWQEKMHPEYWDKADAIYHRSNKGGGSWEVKNHKLPESWQVSYKDLTFNIKLMGFKHTGLFPEQAYNWNLIREKIKNAKRPVKVLNLFAYTGAASVAAASAGAEVVHVDSSRGMVDWAKENLKSSHLENKPVRFLVDDCLKFVKREQRRGNKYDIILMDPPSFGRGSNGEVWDIEKDLFPLVKECMEILSDDPILFLINSYTTGLSKTVLENVLYLTINKKHQGFISSDEIGLPMKDSELILPCGIYARWEKEKNEE
ncbi:MAG: class I SAM-dependent methyltransferase [Bacilli bacterium]|nr:class I SAM-dependent methyltransferase [Bacilli bacterium]